MCGFPSIGNVTYRSHGKNSLYIGIMPAMFSPRSTVTRSLAIWLPLCFVWVFVACVSLCSLHGAGEHNTPSVLSQVADSSHESNCCPIREATSWVLPERQSSNPQAGGDVQAASVPLVLPTGYAPYSNARMLIQPSTSDPPLERLCALRI